MRKIFSSSLMVGILALFLACVSTASLAQTEPGPAHNVYQQQVPPMATLECAKCHTSIFEDIKDRGGLHQQECIFCHKTFHNFKKGVPWTEKVPSCESCHDQPHGKDFPDCLACHANAHAPIASLTNMKRLAPDCVKCHSAQEKELKDFPSAHTEVACTDCHHSRHGNIPSCLECHEEPHLTFKNNAACQACHAVHSPLRKAYSNNIPNYVCAGCHAEVNEKLVSSGKKHSVLDCTLCHANTHGYIPACEDCHGTGPHNSTMVKKFQGCRTCHGGPHVLKLKN